MRVWRYAVPTSATDPTPVEHRLTEAEILAQYFPYWSSEMQRLGRTADISAENCLADWVVVHWAEAVPGAD